MQKHPFNTYLFPPAGSPNCSEVWFSCLFGVFFSLSLFPSSCDGDSGRSEINRLFGLLFLPRAALNAT